MFKYPGPGFQEQCSFFGFRHTNNQKNSPDGNKPQKKKVNIEKINLADLQHEPNLHL